jgi:hypothetical protein
MDGNATDIVAPAFFMPSVKRVHRLVEVNWRYADAKYVDAARIIGRC